MNIKVKAAAQVALFIVAAMAAGGAVRVGLGILAETYGELQVIHGICMALLALAAYLAVGLLYDMRLTQLKYQQRLRDTRG
jgi:hypothetical protein